MLKGIVDWATDRARMIVIFVLLSLSAGWIAYTGLPKEGEPDIDIPLLSVSLPFPGISAVDAEKLLVKPMEREFQGIDGLKDMTGVASEGYANVVLEFEFGWDKQATIADVRDKLSTAESNFPEGTEEATINEINFSQFPILVIALSGDLPERELTRVAKELQSELEGLPAILEAGLAGSRDEMVEVIIDPLRLETYNVTAQELVNVVVNNNQLIAAGEIETDTGAFAVKIPSSFETQQDIYDLPVKVNGDSVIRLGQLAEIRLTFEDATGTARFNGTNTVALQIVKRKGFNHVDTVAAVRETVEKAKEKWPEELKAAIRADEGLDQSRQVISMIDQLEGSVLTAVLLVMIVVLAALGVRSALLVGFAIPTSFLLSFAFMAVAGITISNIVMFGLILAVGMLVDGAIVVVEYADRRIREGVGPMKAYGAAAKRMFWPIISSTATTLCAFLPMLFWPGIPGEFMGNLPVTLIYVLSASLLVALVYLPVIGGVAGRISRWITYRSNDARRYLHWSLRLLGYLGSALALLLVTLEIIKGSMIAILIFVVFSMLTAIFGGSLRKGTEEDEETIGEREYQRSWLGHVANFFVGNPYMPVVSIVLTGFVVVSTFTYYQSNNYGSEFFVDQEPENAIIYVRGRGNLSLQQKDDLVQSVERRVLEIDGVKNVFAFAGDGGLNNNTGGGEAPSDAIGQVQIELERWEIRGTGTGKGIMSEVERAVANIPGVIAEIAAVETGPASGKPLFIRVKGDDLDLLEQSADIVRAKLDDTPGLTLQEDNTPLPGIDWQIDVDVAKAGRYGADVATVGAMVQLVTRGLFLDTMNSDSSDDEIEIRVRLPEEDRLLSTLDTLKVRTGSGLVPLSNFIERRPVEKLAQIQRFNTNRYYDIKSDLLPRLLSVEPQEPNDNMAYSALVQALESDTAAFANESADRLTDQNGNLYKIINLQEITKEELQTEIDNGAAALRPVTANTYISEITQWFEEENPLDTRVTWEWKGDQEEEAESMAFLGQAFLGALGLMFVILLAQFNSFYNSVLVLLAVILSTTGVLIGMLVLAQPFSIIMTGTGIVALAGIVVNNNIVLIDTYQEYARMMPRIEAIIRTVEVRIRPVLLTTITTMAGLTPMMLGVSFDFANGGYTIDAPTSLWWKQLATAVVWGLGVATILTLFFTPAMLALRVWFVSGNIAAYRWIRSKLSKKDRAPANDKDQDAQEPLEPVLSASDVADETKTKE